MFVGACGVGPGTDAASVLYLTDANGFFGMTVDIVRSMQLYDHLPPLLVVGIGYRMGALRETVDIRVRDLTPTDDAAYTRLFPEHSRLGGAPAFLAFVRDELIPWVGDRYPVAAADRAYFGHSLGGLFGAWTLLTAPDTFQRYVIGSPSLWWEFGAIADVERAYAGAHTDLAATVFFGIGSEETHEGRQREQAHRPEEARRRASARHIDMVDDLRRLVDRLERRGYPSLRACAAVFPDEFHVTVPQLTLSRGLRWLYDAPR
ncbi:MAG TPA: alpha/beta hydrolase-fold protein [Candidatus Dormibacteraeota bacterium]